MATMGLLLDIAGGASSHLRSVKRHGPRGGPRRGLQSTRGARPMRKDHRVADSGDRDRRDSRPRGNPPLAVADVLRGGAGAEVVFVGGDRAEARPGSRRPANELRRIRVAGLSRSNSSPRGPAPCCWPGARPAARPRACCASLRPDAVLGGGGLCGRSGRAGRRRAAARRSCLTESRQPPRGHQPACWRRSPRARLPRVLRWRVAAGPRFVVDRPAGCRRPAVRPAPRGP